MPAFDPRLFQIASLAGLLAYGVFVLNFGIRVPQAITLIAACFVTQYVGSRLCRLPRVEWRSAAISALSLCLLLRTNYLWLAALGAVIAIGSKFALRFHGKHLFNPTNFGLIAAMLLSDDRVWVSPGQWGNAAFIGFLMVCLGGLVVNRAMRSDVTLAFLVFYLGLVFGRSIYLGEPMTTPSTGSRVARSCCLPSS